MDSPIAPAAPQLPVIAITFNPADGSVSVNGAIENKLLAFGMLELAKEAISEYHKQAMARIQAPSADAVRAFGKKVSEN